MAREKGRSEGGISFGHHPGHPPDDVLRTRVEKRRGRREGEEEEQKKKTVKVLSG